MKTNHITIIIIFAFIVFLSTSCMENAKIQVQNKVHNVKLEKISWDDYNLYQTLIPGQISDECTISDYDNEWPKKGKLKFYMVSDDKSVYLETQASYELGHDETLVIVISDTTKVVNPLLE